MAAQKSPIGLPLGDMKKLAAMLVLLAVLAAIWAPKLMKRKPPATAAEPASAGRAEAASTRGSDGAAAEAKPDPVSRVAPTATAEGEPSRVLGDPPPSLARDPFGVSEAMARLMRKPDAPADGTGAETEAADQAATRAEAPARPTLNLEATVIDGELRYGLINGEIVVEGQEYAGMKVRAVREREVVLEGPDGVVRLTME